MKCAFCRIRRNVLLNVYVRKQGNDYVKRLVCVDCMAGLSSGMIKISLVKRWSKR